MDMVVISSAKFIKKKTSIYLAPLFNSCSQKVRSALSVVAVVTYKDACKMVLQADEKKKERWFSGHFSSSAAYYSNTVCVCICLACRHKKIQLVFC